MIVKQEKDEKTTLAVKNFPTLTKEKEPLLSGTVKLSTKLIREMNRDQEGYRLDLKPTPDESLEFDDLAYYQSFAAAYVRHFWARLQCG